MLIRLYKYAFCSFLFLLTGSLCLCATESGRVFLVGGDASLVPPLGWSLDLEAEGLAGVAVPPSSTQGRLGHIEVRRFHGPRLVDKTSAVQWGQRIQKLAGEFRSDTVSLLDAKLVALTDYRPGILVYTQFENGEKSMMQAHLLASSRTYHYLLSFTDLESRFGAEHSQTNFSRVWQSMISLHLDSKTPKSPLSFEMLAIFAALVIALILFLFARAMQAPRMKP